MVDRLFGWADKDIEKLFKNIDKRDFVLWVIALATSMKVMLTYTRLFKLIYLLQIDLRGRLPTEVVYRFAEFHFGPYDSELQSDIEKWSMVQMVEHEYRKWKPGSNVPSFDLKTTSFGEDYVKRISEPRLMNALGPDTFDVLRKKTKEYLQAKESDIIKLSWEKWSESQTDESKRKQVLRMLDPNCRV